MEGNAIDIDSSWFQVSFLKHEAQHLSDYKRFLKLSSRVLEYRAKLIEIIYGPEVHKLIENFIYQAKDDRDYPHQYAAYVIIKQLSYAIFRKDFVKDKGMWEKIDNVFISKTATELLLKSTRALVDDGNDTEVVIL